MITMILVFSHGCKCTDHNLLPPYWLYAKTWIPNPGIMNLESWTGVKNFMDIMIMYFVFVPMVWCREEYFLRLIHVQYMAILAAPTDQVAMNCSIFGRELHEHLYHASHYSKSREDIIKFHHLFFLYFSGICLIAYAYFKKVNKHYRFMSINIIDDTYIVAVWHILSYTIKCISTQVLAAFNFFYFKWTFTGTV